MLEMYANINNKKGKRLHLLEKNLIGNISISTAFIKQKKQYISHWLKVMKLSLNLGSTT